VFEEDNRHSLAAVLPPRDVVEEVVQDFIKGMILVSHKGQEWSCVLQRSNK